MKALAAVLVALAFAIVVGAYVAAASIPRPAGCPASAEDVAVVTLDYRDGAYRLDCRYRVP